MKNKILKISIILVTILAMTMTNFIFVGASLISYAADGISTNHKNVEFEAYFKEGEKDAFYLRVNVKKEGYFNGEVTVGNSNFTIKEANSAYVNKIENNTIYLNQINAGTAGEIKVVIEPIKEENFAIGLLSMTSEVSLKGIYRDSTQKNINIQASRDIAFQLEENNTTENVQNEIKVITNKIAEVDGQEKRMVQLSYHVGLKENNYPIQEINAKIMIPTIDGKQAEIKSVRYLNNMTSYQEQLDGNNLELILRNEANQEGKAMWKKQGDENIVITCLYDTDVKTENMKINTHEMLRLYNGKEIEAENEIVVGTEELDATIEVNAKNEEEMIYKGKINAGIDRQYQTETQVKVNLAKAVKNIEIVEENSQYTIGDRQERANVTYYATTIAKAQFDELFGQNGTITIRDQNENVIATITNATPMDQEGNIVIHYDGKEVSKIMIQTTAPVAEGMLQLHHSKMIHSDEKAKEANELKNKVTVNGKVVEAVMKLENTTQKATLEINRETLSTVVRNNVEIKAILTANDEKYDLYKNPEITIELPEDVENVEINSIDILYENELEIKNYTVEGRMIKVYLEGEQTQYKETVEGAMVVINTTVDVNRKATTKDEEIRMGNESKAIKIVAPTDITPIYSVQALGVETLGQEEIKQVLVQRGAEEKQLEAQIEIINNNEEEIENVKILGDFPTDTNANNMGIEITEGIQLQGIENAKIYYTENTEATDEVEKEENGWSENIQDGHKVSKYLIIIEQIQTQESIKGTYPYKIPARLEYNQTAKTKYTVKYTNSNTKVENELASTAIEMQTGIGAKVETKLTATTGGKQINGPIKNGEVIRYRIEVANTGTEDVKDVFARGKVPEGTTMVQPEANYEYTGASYYEELDNKTYETTIENLKVGEVVDKEYEVRVNSQVTEGTTLSNVAEIQYGDVTKQSDEIKNVTAKGNLRVSVKRVTDRSVDLYTAGVVQYFAIIENISNEKQENVKIQTHLPENLEVEVLTLYTGMEKEQGELYVIGSEDEGANISEMTEQSEGDNVKSEILEYKEEVNIGALEAGETKVLSYDMLINNKQDKNQINFSVTAKLGQEEYQSNNWQDEVKNVEIGISMTTNTSSQYLQAGDKVEYTIVVENKSNVDTTGLVIKDTIPMQLTVNKITQDGQEIEGIEGNIIDIPLRMSANQTTTIVIETVVNYSEARDKAEAITNIAYAEIYGQKVATTSEINHIIQANANGTSGENNGNEIDDNDIAKGNRTITGIAWYDENANGQKDQGEALLSDIKVRLLNAQTNNFVKEESGKTLEATTNENGVYVLDKIGNGNYIVIFDYDNTQYALTKYKADGVSETENSNAMVNELFIGNEKQQLASTDILQIQDNNISDINIGFIKLENFDLKLDKYVSKILIQNANGTTVREYNNETMAKVELDAKTINGSTVIIEYKINVTNNGEVEGYAKKIADYASTDLKFSSELNKDWYQVGDTLYTASLANERIKPGETKTVTLTLTKTMTENSTGLIPNTAEIAEDYNELGIADSNSTPGNRAKGENDLGVAEVVLSIRTGGIVYVSIAVIIVVVLGGIAVIVIKKRKKQENE